MDNFNDAYFHAFDFKEEVFIDIMLHGIKCKILQGYFDKNSSYNGSFYISLYKGGSDNECMKLIQSSPCFIIDKSIKPIKTNSKLNIFNKTPFPIRYSPYENEFQKFLYISPKYIRGIGVRFDETKDLKKQYEILKEILMWIKLLNRKIDFIDLNSKEIINDAFIKKYIK